MTIKKIGRAVPVPSPLALKSPQEYYKLIAQVNPSWANKLPSIARIQRTAACALAAGAVTVANACRISEVLALQVCHLMPNGCAVILGAKGSNARTIYTGFSKEMVEQLKTLPKATPVFPVRYKQVWENLALHGFAVQEPGHVHRTLTHAGRYGLVQNMAPIIGKEKAGQAIGHRSVRSVEYYTDGELTCKEREMRRRVKKNLQKPFIGPRLEDFVGGIFNED